MTTEYDLLIVTDATASMGVYLEALTLAVPEIIALGALTRAFTRWGVLAYRDYSEGPKKPNVLQWSGWNNEDIRKFTKDLKPYGGGDIPEACKTAFIAALEEVDPQRKTLILWYADAGPHHWSNAGNRYSNMEKEIKALEKLEDNPFGTTDWVKLSRLAAEKNCTVIPVVHSGMPAGTSNFFVIAAELTGGTVFANQGRSSEHISRLTLDILLHWMGEPLAESHGTVVQVVEFYKPCKDANPPLEDEEQNVRGYLPMKTKGKSKGSNDMQRTKTTMVDSVASVRMEAGPRLPNLGKTFSSPNEATYRDIVYGALNDLINSNVLALTYNAVFGTLWRAVCKDRSDPRRDELVNLFSQQVGKERDPDRRQILTDWLEDSYDSAEEIEELIKKAPDHGDPKQKRFYLDLDANIKLTRQELLEVARSLFPGVLKKLASILTHIKLVEEDVTLLENQRSIPLSLNPKDLFCVLPHLVVPGTLFTVRAAALMAALSMTVGVPFLDEPARQLLGSMKGKWLDTDIPENLSYECAKLLVGLPQNVALNEQEEAVYRGMRRYRLIELNMESQLEAQVPWTPEKTREVGDVQIQCNICKKKRSITIMSETEDVCGLCCWEATRRKLVKHGDYAAKSWSPIDPANIKEQTEQQSCWVECSMTTCRAQYVVVHPHALQVRPKCHYCRNSLPCPWIQCTDCANRVIIPGRYRKEGASFRCIACRAGRKTIVPRETTTRELAKENGREWLGFDREKDLFGNWSAFKLFSKYGGEVFTGQPDGRALTLDGKHVHNASALLHRIEGRVASGQVEKGTCSLCFDDAPYHMLRPACGRSGCKQRADDECLKQWYGDTKPGQLLNPNQLQCPFCRRRPTTKLMMKYNELALALGDLRAALDDRAWYYAWCMACGSAKRAVERACAQAGLPEIKDFVCEDCQAAAEALRAQIEREAEEARAANNEDDWAERHRLLRLLKKTPHAMAKIQKCPKCDIMVEKLSGCNHITCICGTHFCFLDGLEFGYPEIYDHLVEVHGSIGGGWGGNEEEEEEEEY